MKKATALKYDQTIDKAPKMIAKGTNKNAHHIIKLAKENNIPIKKDPDLVELLSKLELNQEIPPDLYKAVSAIFRFLYRIDNENKTNS